MEMMQSNGDVKEWHVWISASQILHSWESLQDAAVACELSGLGNSPSFLSSLKDLRRPDHSGSAMIAPVKTRKERTPTSLCEYLEILWQCPHALSKFNVSVKVEMSPEPIL